MGFQSFEDIEAWQEGRKLSQQIRIFADRAVTKKDWTWSDQISRAALSITANIAEGNDCTTNAEFVVFLGYAKRSSAEVRSHLYYGLDRNYLSKQEFDSAYAQAKKIGAQLAKLMQYLQSHSDKHRISKSKPANKPTSQPSN